MQTILGSGGTIGIPLAKELRQYTDQIRLVSRHPKKINTTDELYPLDVNELPGLEKAIEGSEVVYVTVGFKFELSTWQKVWPPFMKQVIDACEKYQSRLVFFDNMYMYSASSLSMMTEDAPLDPPSKKGLVRAQLVRMILEAKDQGKINALIARSADFYGPDCKNSILGETVVKNLVKGKKAQVLGKLGKVHTYTYTPDAAKATALLGNTASAFGQVWHLPTTKERLTQQDWINLVAKELGVPAKTQFIPRWMLLALGLFIKPMREFPEMLYQGEMDYVFDSSKIEKEFGLLPVNPEEGIREMVDYFRKQP